MEFKTIETQEELDHIIQEHVSKFHDYEQVKQQLADLQVVYQTLQSETETAKNAFEQDIATYKKQIQSYELEQKRIKAVVENGLPIHFANRLQGETEEQLIADAELLAMHIKTHRAEPPLKTTEKPVESQEKTALKRMLQKLNTK